jgi:DNA-binding transcriptional ArsR family regulator
MPKSKEVCEVEYVHEDRVRSARKAIHDDETLLGLTDTFNVLSDPTRLKIILALLKEELCVCDLAALLKLTDSAVSHQLRMLRDLRLVKYHRNGKMAYYSLDDEHIEDLIRVAIRHISEL